MLPEQVATIFQLSRANRLRILNEMVAASRLPVEEQVAGAARIRDAHAADDAELRQLGWYHQWTTEYVTCQAGLRCALLAVASERYRQDHGAWPDALSALVEHHYISHVPLDPHDGQPLRYRQFADGVVFYSVGPDRVDHGGLPNRATLPMGTDVAAGFRLWDAAR